MTFNPDISRLRENLSAIEGAVACIIVFDNGSKNVDDIRQLLADVPAAFMIESSENFGIATALNGIVGAAGERGADWVLLLDQDSVCRPGLPLILAEHASEDIAIICPDIVDRNLPSRMATTAPAVSDVEACITSGSLTSIAAWSEVGGYDQGFFIDYVDFDFCLRLRMAGYRIVRDPRASLLHELGNSKKYWKFTSYNYSEFRLYHMSRDMIYYSVKHRAIKATLKMNGRGLFGNLLVLLKKIVVILCFEKRKARKAWAVLRGAASGLLTAAASGNGVNAQ
ncbi:MULTISPECIES: glycosyltransferase [unclassified Rhodococcus (in: high G+C Gram-positive bacteria)]|uniref:glycosyltransferase n=1 Tax=unclassified Rhodococcus (in: high G+C Gram-positive bacteria) TaxID=192944 RepID=UPI00159605FC|nr:MULTISPECIES: glycosyltransferase family 2 protein [unclassified Rhodococcus (in: high G+C Gram-positive bacteria)]